VGEREGHLVGDPEGEVHVLLAKAPHLAGVEGERSDGLPFEPDRDPQARPEPGREEDRPAGGVGREVGLRVADDLVVGHHLRAFRVRDRVGVGDPVAVPGDGPHPVLRPVLRQEPERHPVVREDLARDRRDLVEDLADVERPREGGGEGVELPVPPDPPPLLLGEPLVLERGREDVGDRLGRRLVGGPEPTCRARGEPEVPERHVAADDRRDEHRAHSRLEELAVPLARRVEEGGDVVDPPRRRGPGPENVGEVFPAVAAAPFDVARRREAPREEGGAFDEPDDAGGVERQDAARGAGDAGEDLRKRQRFRHGSGDFGQDADERIDRARVHGVGWHGTGIVPGVP
jgi:hypothetical protein